MTNNTEDVEVMSNIFYTLQDDSGKLYPIAGIFKHNEYGLDDAEERATKTDLKVVTVELTVVEQEN